MAASWAKRRGISAAALREAGVPPRALAGAGLSTENETGRALASPLPRTYVRSSVGGDWRRGFEYAWQEPDSEPDEGPRLTWRETGTNYWSGSWGSQPRGTVMLETSGLWVAYVRLEDPPGLSPIATVGRYATVEAAQVATD